MVPVPLVRQVQPSVVWLQARSLSLRWWPAWWFPRLPVAATQPAQQVRPEQRVPERSVNRKWRLRALFFLERRFLDLRRLHVVLLVSAAGLAGCASGTNLVSDVVRGVVAERFGEARDPLMGVKLNPDYRYLRVEVAGRPPALLVLGYIDPHADGEIEVWYSAKQEVIKTQNGRILATFGLETDWRAVRLQPATPPWAADPVKGMRLERVRDEMPGYRYAITDLVDSRPWPSPPPQGVPAVFSNAAAHDLQWFREVSVSNVGRSAIPPAWFARGRFGGRDRVVYSEQCLAPAFCLRLLRWPIEDGAG